MKNIHKRFSLDQVKTLFVAYLKKRMTREEVEQELGISKTRFFALLKRYRMSPDTFSFSYHRRTPTRLTSTAETAIIKGLQFDKLLITNPDIPISWYNYSALRDRLREKEGITVSVKTIIPSYFSI